MQSAYHHKVPDVKFSSFVEERLLDVFLNYICFFGSIFMFLVCFEEMCNLIGLINDSDAFSSVGKLSWLNNPDIFQFVFPSIFNHCFDFLELFQKFMKFRIRKTMLYMEC